MSRGPVAILGATSQLARDFIVSARTAFDRPLLLYARRPDAVAALAAAHGPGAVACDLNAFGSVACDAVINFVGVGDPGKAAQMGAAIFDVTDEMDQRVMRYLGHAPSCKYVFLSSGAVYGNIFASGPATASSEAVFPVNAISPGNFYSLAKLGAEARHRAAASLNILDIRVFSYVSRTMALDSRFLLADIANAIRQGTVMESSDVEIHRDFAHPRDLFQLIARCVDAPGGGNFPVDLYSQAPVSKTALLELMQERFGLKYRIVSGFRPPATSGDKNFYFSENRRAAALGYAPAYSSQSALISEFEALLEVM